MFIFECMPSFHRVSTQPQTPQPPPPPQQQQLQQQQKRRRRQAEELIAKVK
jgi:hypothetical protein